MILDFKNATQNSFISLKNVIRMIRGPQAIFPLAFFILLFPPTVTPLVAQQAQEVDSEEVHPTLEDNGKPVRIRAIDISVKGLSNKKILRNRLGVQVGDQFGNLTSLRQILDIGVNNLRSTGYFKKDGGVGYRLLIEENSGEQQLVKLEADFQDAWTVYPVAFPYYSTASGFGVRGRLRWDNFLGLLGNVTFRADATEVRNGNYGPNLSGGVGIGTIQISPDLGVNGSLNISRPARVDGANWDLGVSLGGYLRVRSLESRGIGMGYWFSNNSSVAFGYTGNVTSQPYFSTSFSHGLGLGKESYSSGGVLRNGYRVSLSNSYSLDSNPGNLYTSPALALEDIQLNFSLNLSRSYFDALNFKGRAGIGKSFDFNNGSYNKSGYNYGVSGYNRGKRDGAVAGNFIVYLNMDMAVLVFSDSLLGDLLLEPFLDVTWVNNANGFHLENASLGSGFELIWVFHSLNLRFTYGIDLQQPKLYTISITTGFFF